MFPVLFRAHFFVLTLMVAAACQADTYTATAPISHGDIAAGRADALRDILWDVGIGNNALVSAKAISVGDDHIQATTIRSAFRLSKFEIVKEEVFADRIRITASVDKVEDASKAPCESRFPLRNIDFVWRGTTGQMVSEATQRGTVLLGALVKDTLRQELRPYFLDSGIPSKEAVYRIIGYLDIGDHRLGFEPVRGVRLQIRSADNSGLIREIYLPAESETLAIKEKRDLGYANLVTWQLTESARTLADNIRTRLGDELRCLPAVVRIPEPRADGGLMVAADSAVEISQRGMVLFASTWPVLENGDIDLLKIDGVLQPRLKTGKVLEFPAQKRYPGRKYPIAGGYIVFQ